VVVGQSARVISSVPLNIRPQPGTTLARIGTIPIGETVPILAGFTCAEGYTWWQISYNDLQGWVAEGGFGEYWLEPRGEITIIPGEDGINRQFVTTSTGELEPEGCLRPPDDYTREQVGYATLNRRTLFMLDNATRIYRDLGGELNFRQLITQGSYNAGGVAASFGTHDGGGAVDISVRSPLDWSVMDDEIPYMIESLRIAGFAAWVRFPDELYAGSPIHIHAIAVGDAELSPIARQQIDGERGYLRGYNGLPAEYYPAPELDPHGDLVMCEWMVLDGFPDQRTVATYFNVGMQQMALADYERAVQNFTLALNIDPNHTDSLIQRGQAYFFLRNPQAALADYERYIALGNAPLPFMFQQFPDADF